MNSLQERVFTASPGNFDELALEVFAYQYGQVPVYRQFCDNLKATPAIVKDVIQIPFLPIQFFKSHQVIADNHKAQKIFESSGTTGAVTSRHMVADLELYESSFVKGFHHFYGNPKDYVILALLPSYLERDNSSLVYMVKRLMDLSGRPENAFFLHNMMGLHNALMRLKSSGQKVLLIGVTFALLDFVELCALDFPGLTVMETGGMKGRREELTREEVHARLKLGFGVSAIHSEYGMTELLSQAYSKGEGVFETVPWMRILLRDLYDPLQAAEGNSGAINVIDLANIYSCSFIATNDLGRNIRGGGFEVLGRMDNAEMRGCNLMYA